MRCFKSSTPTLVGVKSLVDEMDDMLSLVVFKGRARFVGPMLTAVLDPDGQRLYTDVQVL
jgi:hypothetical protein